MNQKESEISVAWEGLLDNLQGLFQKKPDVNSVLFLIGVQELGQGPRNFSKEEKQDLMHIAICKVLSFSGYYELKGLDKEGWPQWELNEKLPFFKLNDQETLLKMHILEYFKREVSI